MTHENRWIDGLYAVTHNPPSQLARPVVHLLNVFDSFEPNLMTLRALGRMEHLQTGLVCLSIDIFTKFINHGCNGSESNVWHSWLYHINFGSMTRLKNLRLIPNFTIVKGSKCLVCVQAKLPCKSRTTAEARNVAPLGRIHSDLVRWMVFWQRVEKYISWLW